MVKEPNSINIPQDSYLKILRQHRNSYSMWLGELFRDKDAFDLAKLSLNSQYKDFVEDYIYISCVPLFRKTFEKVKRKIIKKSILEQSAQSSPICNNKGPDIGTGVWVE